MVSALLKPKVEVTVKALSASFKTIFKTPAIASEPYCAEAPSLNNSILFMAEIGIAFKSVPELPLPLVPYKFIKDALCLLFPLIKTNVWSGPRPLIVAGSI